MKALRARIILLLLALCLLLTGCGKNSGESSLAAHAGKDPERPMLTLCVDLNPGMEASSSGPVSGFLETVPGYLEDFGVKVEEIPCQGAERDAALTRVRTELLSGSGPDLFICVCPKLKDIFFRELNQEGWGTEGLFQYPPSVMKQGFFLPLDDYIANAQYMQWDELIPIVMEAGRNEKGQLILPLTYGFSASLAERESCTLTEELPLSWNDMLTSSDPYVRFAACSWEFGSVFGQLGDYSKDEPAFTEEELSARLEEARAANLAGRPEDLPETSRILPDVNIGTQNSNILNPKSPDYIMIPKYNAGGGVTATIASFAAINASTQYPDEAFQILDKLLDRESMANCEIYVYGGNLPVNREAGQKDSPYYCPFELNGKQRTNWYVSQWNFQQIQEIAGQINAVNFGTPLNHELLDAYQECLEEEDPAKRRELAAEHYTTMKMMMAES